MRRRHHPRGTKRGRPRGSTRRGGGHGSMQRVLTPTQTGAVSVPGAGAAPAPATPTPAEAGPGPATSSPLPQQEVTGGGENVGEEGKYTGKKWRITKELNNGILKKFERAI